MNIICFFIGIKRTLRYWWRTGCFENTISGHSYVEQDDGSLVCKRCLHKSE